VVLEHPGDPTLHSFQLDLAFLEGPWLQIHPLLLALLLSLLNPLILVDQFAQVHRDHLLDQIFLGFLLILAALYCLLYLVVQAYQPAQQILGFPEGLEVPVLPSFL